MLVSIKSTILLAVILLSVTVLSVTSTPSAYGHFTPLDSDHIIQHHNELNDELMWKLGDNIQKGDVYEYKICSDRIIFQVIYPYHCYNMELEFVTILESYKGKVWVVQGNFTTPDISNQMILLINPDTFQVDTDLLNVDLGNSLENTIFSLSVYGDKSVSIGKQWDTIPSYFTNDVPLEIKRHELIDTKIGIIDTMVLGYDVIQQFNYYISDLSFPVKASIFSPNIIFPHPIEEYWYELEYYSNKLDYTSYNDEPIEHPVSVEVRPK